MSTLKILKTRLEALDDDFHFFRGAGATKTKVAAAEKKLGVVFRADHRAIIEDMGAFAVLADEKVWPQPIEFEVRPAWQFHSGIELFGLPAQAVPALDVVAQTESRKPAGKRKLVAAMRRVGDRHCAGYDAKGTLFEWAPGEAPEPSTESSLTGMLLSWLKTLAADKEKIKASPPAVAKGKAAAKGSVAPVEKTASKGSKRSVAEWVTELLDDSGDQDEAGAQLYAEGDVLVGKVIRALVAQAKADDDTDAVWGLSRIEKDERAVDALIALAKKGDGEIRTTALGVLGALDGKHERVVPVLTAALADSDDDVRDEAAEALAEYAFPSAIEPLRRALAKEQENPAWVHGVLAGHLLRALGASGSGLPEVVDLLVDTIALVSTLPPVSRYAALPAFEALVAMKEGAKNAMPALTKIAEGKDPYLATLARRALVSAGESPDAHLRALRASAKSKDGALAAVAARAVSEAEMAKIVRSGP